MARHILIVEPSGARRRELQSKILTILDDVIISEAVAEEQALAFFERGTVHVVLYGWREGGESFLDALCEGREIALLVLVHGREREEICAALGRQGVAALAMPCADETLCAAVDRVCSPVRLRREPRLSVPGAGGVLEQGGRRFEIEVLNVSEGGLLADFEAGGGLDCLRPVVLDLTFPCQGGTRQGANIYAVVSHFKVMARHRDFTPRSIRAGFSFIIVPEAAAAVIRDVIAELS